MTDEQKQEVTDRLLAAWKKEPKLRLGQFIYCVIGGNDDVLFNIEDYPLAERMELWSRVRKRAEEVPQ